MFERFTKEARAAVERAGDEAVAAGAPQIDREHLLLALAAAEPRLLAPLGLRYDALAADLAATGGALDADALAAIGIDLDEVRRRVEAAFGPDALSARRRGHRRFAPKAKRTLELAVREALALGDRHIGAEHLLLALMRDPGERVGALLAGRGQSPAAVRAAALAARRRAAPARRNSTQPPGSLSAAARLPPLV
jgi:ATP-dependent Clp protease ATP-binding subunit ClpA